MVGVSEVPFYPILEPSGSGIAYYDEIPEISLFLRGLEFDISWYYEAILYYTGIHLLFQVLNLRPAA
jgi:hypothetical protein